VAAKEKIRVGGILKYRDLCLVGVMSAPDRPGLNAAVFRTLGERQLNVQFIVHSIDLNRESHIQFCAANEDCNSILAALAPLAAQVGAKKVITQPGVALLCVFGPDFRERPGIAGAMFGALADAGINILAVSTSISTISCVIGDQQFDLAMEAMGHVFASP
jgi:aspartate kinase